MILRLEMFVLVYTFFKDIKLILVNCSYVYVFVSVFKLIVNLKIFILKIFN